MAAFPAQAVIQYDHAFMKPSGFPNPARAYAYGPPSAGRRRASAPKRIASTSAPTVVSAMETSVIGPYGASDVGRLKMPTPMIDPMIRAIAAGRPNWPDFSSGASARACAATSVTSLHLRFRECNRRSGLPGEQCLRVRDRADHSAAAGLLDERARRLHLRAHRPLGELARRQLSGRDPVDRLLLGRPPARVDRVDIGDDGERVGLEVGGEQRAGQ